MNDPTIARVRFDDGSQRPVFEALDGRQYVLDRGVKIAGTPHSPRLNSHHTYRSSTE
jgi:hypothetical protein